MLTMLDQRQAKRDVFVLDGTFGLVGRLDGLHIDPDGEAWGTVHCGTFGARTRLVPLRGAQWWSGYLRVACSRHQVRTAPEAEDDVLLGAVEADALREHYRVAEDESAGQRFFRPEP
jgi:hypothetical protein